MKSYMNQTNLVRISLCGIMLLSLAFYGNAQMVTPKFKDVSKEAGLSQVKANKYWSPCVADFNRDGYYDLILANHGGNKEHEGEKYYSPELYWGTSTGYTPFKHSKDMMAGIPIGGTDYHGFSAGYFGNKDSYPDLVLTIGGANGGRGNLPVVVEFSGEIDNYVVRRDINRKDPLVDKSLEEVGIDGFGRGRSSLFIDVDQDGDLDLIYNNKGPNEEKEVTENISDSKFMYEWKDGKYSRIQEIGDIKNSDKECAAIADVNHDGRIDLLYFDGSESMECWISQGDGFEFKLDNSFFPAQIGKVSAIAELDYDADGDFDLYLARSGYKTAEDDILLEWDAAKKKYIDVTKKAKLPKGGMTQGVSVGDFDNNGYQDIFLGVANMEDERTPDLILMNKGDKTFEVISSNGPTAMNKGEDGDQGEVFDYDKDGKVDILSGSRYGLWRMFKNTTENPKGNFILVQVGRSNSKESFAPQGAVVTVTANKGKEKFTVMRRIGSQGQSHGQSFLDTMHFGLGEFDSVSEITVSYGTYNETTKFKGAEGKAGKIVTVGKFPTTAK